MKFKILCGMIFSAALMALSGCGGGGGGGTSAAPTVVSGVASKGLFVSGKVDIFGVDPVTSGKGTLLKTTSLDATGFYQADISPYTGPILIEVSGSYKDEATGATVVLAPATPLRVAISNAAGNVPAMVTPLTELAVRKLNNVFTKTAVDTINKDVATIFKLDDITKTKPIDATLAAPAGATAAEKNQSLVLAAISQMVKNSGDTTANALDKLLTGMAADISGSTLAEGSTAGFKTALFDFVGSKNNQTDTTTATIATAPVNIGTFKLAHLKISTAGLAAAAKVGAIDFTFNLPAGVTLTKDATNQVTPGIVVAAGVGAATTVTSGVQSIATINAQALRTMMVNAQGFGAGEFVDISCTIPATVTTSIADLKTDFDTKIKAATVLATDATGTAIPGISLTAVVDVF